MRCDNDALLSKIGLKSVQKTHEISFNVLTDIENCKRINTRQYISVVSSATTYNRNLVPDDRFNCLPIGCRNTGTLMINSPTTGDDFVASGKFSIAYDATEFYAGVTTYYLYFDDPGTYTVTTTMSNISDEAQTNADVYEKQIVVNEAGFYPIVVDFSEVPSSVTGNGWTATEAGAIINIEVEGASAFDVGISSIYFYDSVLDFQVNDVVNVGCLTDVSADLGIDANDNTCFAADYDPDSTSLEFTITGNTVTPNYFKMNPLISKTDVVDGWELQTDDRTVQSTTINGTTYGYIQVPDMDITECGFTKVMLNDNCNVVDSNLDRVQSPIPITISETQFIVLDGTTTDPLDAGKILLHETLIGQKVIVQYPKAVTMDEWAANDKNVNHARVRMVIPFCYNDGTTGYYIFENVLVTSFPFTIAVSDTSEFSFTITVARDPEGNWYKVRRIRD